MHPAAADHRGDDLDLAELPRRALERVAVEHDEVGEVAGEELAAPALVAGEPGGGDAGRVQGLLDGDRLLGVPGLALVEGASDAGPDAEERVELLDRGVGAVGDDGARVDQRAEGVGAVRLPGPVASARSRSDGAWLNWTDAATPSSAKRGEVLGREQLRVLDPLAEAARVPLVPRLLEGVEGARLARSPIACTATGKPARAARRTMSTNSS